MGGCVERQAPASEPAESEQSTFASPGKSSTALSRCLTPDSVSQDRLTLVFSDYTVDSLETGDISGVRLYLHRSVAGWTGEYQEAAGEWGAIHPGVNATIQELTGSAELRIPHGPDLPDTSLFHGSISCDSLWGTQLTYQGQGEHRAIYTREALDPRQ